MGGEIPTYQAWPTAPRDMRRACVKQIYDLAWFAAPPLPISICVHFYQIFLAVVISAKKVNYLLDSGPGLRVCWRCGRCISDNRRHCFYLR
jgi:hypothetical protein